MVKFLFPTSLRDVFSRHHLAMLLFPILMLGNANTAIADNKPVLALVKYGVWEPLAPEFILYEDGSVIYQRSKSRPSEFFTVRLGAEDEYKIFSLLNAEFAELNGEYTLSEAYDLTTYTIMVWKPIHTKVSVYGLGSKENPAPAAFEKLYRFLKDFDRSDAVEWLPDHFTVDVYKISYDKWVYNPIPWPAHWPPLGDITESNKTHYHLRVPGSDLNLLKSMCPGYGREHPVQIGRKQFIVEYSRQFPHENFIFSGIRARNPAD